MPVLAGKATFLVHYKKRLESEQAEKLSIC